MAPVLCDDDVVFDAESAAFCAVLCDEFEVEVLGLCWVLFSGVQKGVNEVDSGLGCENHAWCESAARAEALETRVCAASYLAGVGADVVHLDAHLVPEAVRLENECDSCL